MAQIINISIDLLKVDKSKIKEVQLKKGGTAKFLDLSIFIMDEQDQYGNIASVSINQTKEEREANTPKVYVGNGKRTWAKEPQGKAPAKTNQMGVDESDLPF